MKEHPQGTVIKFIRKGIYGRVQPDGKTTISDYIVRNKLVEGVDYIVVPPAKQTA